MYELKYKRVLCGHTMTAIIGASITGSRPTCLCHARLCSIGHQRKRHPAALLAVPALTPDSGVGAHQLADAGALSDESASISALLAMMAALRPRAIPICVVSSHEPRHVCLASSSLASLTSFFLSLSSYCTPRGISSAATRALSCPTTPTTSRQRVHQRRRSLGARSPASRKS